MADNIVNENITQEVNKAENGQNPNNMTLEALVLLITSERLNNVRNKTESELLRLKRRQKQVSYLHDLMKKLNAKTNSKGELDFSKDKQLQKLMKEIKDMSERAKKMSKLSQELAKSIENGDPEEIKNKIDEIKSLADEMKDDFLGNEAQQMAKYAEDLENHIDDSEYMLGKVGKIKELAEDIEKDSLSLDIKTDKTKYNKDERDRLLDNIRMTVEDLNVRNDMQLQTISRLNNERYETYQMARSILKPLHDDKLNKARAIAGR